MFNIKNLFFLVLISSHAVSDEFIDPLAINKKRFVDLNKEDLIKLRNDAINGDGRAAHQIFLYYAATTKTGIEGFEWLIIAVRNKDPNALKSFKNLKAQGVIDVWVNMLADNATQKAPGAHGRGQ